MIAPAAASTMAADRHQLLLAAAQRVADGAGAIKAMGRSATAAKSGMDALIADSRRV
jgi:hypothetical protein